MLASPVAAMPPYQGNGGSKVVYAGQQYLSIAPRSITVSCVVDAAGPTDGRTTRHTRGGDRSASASSSSSLKHVAAVSCAPTSTSASSGMSRMAFVEWGGASTTAFASRDGEEIADGAESTGRSEGSGGVGYIVQTSVDVSESAAITAFCDLAYGDSGKLCFPVSLDDNTIRVVTRIVDEDDGAVLYKLLGTILRNEGRWSTACVLERRSTGGVVLGVRGSDSTMALVEVKNERLEAMAVLVPTSGALSSFPITQVVPLRTANSDGSMEVLALCHTVVARLQLVLPSPLQGGATTSFSTSGQRGQVVVAQAWRWSPHDPILTIAVRDTFLYGGTQDGFVAAWPLTTPHSNGSGGNGAPIDQFLCVGPSASTDASGSMPPHQQQQRRAPGVVSMVARHAGELITASSDGALCQWTRSTAAGPFQGALLFPGPGAAAQRYGCPSMVDVASTDQFLCAVDDSGMLSVWRWLS